MPVDPQGLLDAISNVLSQIPSGLLVAIFLGGPTAIWLIARFANPPDPAKREQTRSEDLLWVCASCRSINDDRAARCYSCHRSRADETVPGVGVAVGPGLPAAAQTGYWWLGAEATGASRPADTRSDPAKPAVSAPTTAFEPLAFEPLAFEPMPIQPPPLEPLGLEPLALEPLTRQPKAKAPRRRSTAGSVERRGRRKPE
jgi:hypothetical protein